MQPCLQNPLSLDKITPTHSLYPPRAHAHKCTYVHTDLQDDKDRLREQLTAAKIELGKQKEAVRQAEAEKKELKQQHTANMLKVNELQNSLLAANKLLAETAGKVHTDTDTGTGTGTGTDIET
jgi:chromosome segregation ATPase